MLDHVAIHIKGDDYDATVKFYQAFLAPLGSKLARSMVDGKIVGFGPSETNAPFWMASLDLPGMQRTAATSPHIGFRAEDRASVDKCYEEGLKAGGKDNGKPGPRPHYGENYYACFVIDPAGNAVEVVCRAPE